MGQTIRANPDQLEERAKEYRAQAENADSVIRSLDKLIITLESEWEGHSATRFSSNYNELKPSFGKMVELINDLASSLDDTARRLREVDQQR